MTETQTSPGSPNVYGTARQRLSTRLAGPFAARARRKRYEMYRRTMSPGPEKRVVDVGSGKLGLGAFDTESQITGVDQLYFPHFVERNRVSFIQADARALPFDAGEFDIAYSNSLVEHLDPGDRARYAAEIRRVAKRYFVQTPNRWFPIEPHVLLPLFQFMPRPVRRFLWRFGASGEEFEDIPLLTAREMRELFPDAVILRERFGPLTKSIIAAGPAEALPAAGA